MFLLYVLLTVQWKENKTQNQNTYVQVVYTTLSSSKLLNLSEIVPYLS